MEYLDLNSVEQFSCLLENQVDLEVETEKIPMDDEERDYELEARRFEDDKESPKTQLNVCQEYCKDFEAQPEEIPSREQ